MLCDCLFQGQMDRIAQVLQWWNEEQQLPVQTQERSKGKSEQINQCLGVFFVCFSFVLCINTVDVYVINVFHQMHSLLTSTGC